MELLLGFGVGSGETPEELLHEVALGYEFLDELEDLTFGLGVVGVVRQQEVVQAILNAEGGEVLRVDQQGAHELLAGFVQEVSLGEFEQA